ncbi:hypothetical protein DPMN_186806 [Dreissena polymorpha]|uniref:Uncharacterized protein n=1 Tax=Dreissena polymorpha TaxID=45954 RepID=A0A9D4DQZ3_DREPO|nr:hypothetical protein DPMN_186806 [Dreissena polymorpha]
MPDLKELFGCTTQRYHWIEEKFQDIDAILNNNDSKRAYQLLKDPTNIMQGRTTIIQEEATGDPLSPECPSNARLVIVGLYYLYVPRVLLSILKCTPGMKNILKHTWEF